MEGCFAREHAAQARDEDHPAGEHRGRTAARAEAQLSARLATINLEAGFPTAEEARRRVASELEHARRYGLGVLKLIHGYGSTGKGGKLRRAVRAALERSRADGRIGRVVFGEAWSIFDVDSRALLDRYPTLRGDPDLERGNPGITLVEVKP